MAYQPSMDTFLRPIRQPDAFGMGASPIPRFEIAPMRGVSAPVVNVETQTDVEGFVVTLGEGLQYQSVGGGHVRRPDNDGQRDLYRLYEIAGAPHIGTDPECSASSSFPTDAFIRAAAVRLIRWAEDAVAPPSSARIELAVTGEVSKAAGDDVGNAIGGVRSPFVDVPLSTYGAHAESGGLYMLTGDERPLHPAWLAQRYGQSTTT